LKNTSIEAVDLAGEADKQKSLATKSLDELARELANLTEPGEEADIYHAEIIRRQAQDEMDVATAKLASETIRHSFWKIVILGLAILATVATLMFQR
jgi:hypothetical protein